ncbi:MAG: CFI-box-CTERM domain-containing protein [Pseudonocardiaceae bacterium]
MSVRFAFPGGAPERRDQVIQKIGSDWSSPQRPGFCFITTACVVSRGLADDCEELTVLRKLRDGYLSRLTGGPALVSHYYRVAPAIVSALDQREDKAEVYERCSSAALCGHDPLPGTSPGCRAVSRSGP